jgi:predicted amidohydrolase
VSDDSPGKGSLRVAVANQAIGAWDCWADYGAAVNARVVEACRQGGQLLVFPEYGSMEIASLLDERSRGDLHRQLDAMQDWRDEFLALYQHQAAAAGVWILAPSFPWRMEEGCYVNRAWMVGPDGVAGFQDKQQMTRFEAEEWGVSRGVGQHLFAIAGVSVGICICYDIEFPLLARRLVERGAQVLLAPSCTDTLAGYHRVRIGAQARALENQCYVAQACTVGEAPWSPAVDINVGRAAIYGPVDRGFPDDGVVAIAETQSPGWVVAELSMTGLQAVRRNGQVLNHRDWFTQ